MPPTNANIKLILDKFTKESKNLKQPISQQQQIQEVGAFMLFVFTAGLSLAFYVTFKTYHASLSKMDSLKSLLTNPNARVAAGENGQSLLKRFKES